MQSIRETKAYVTIYIGGSVTGGTAIVGDAADLSILHKSKIRGAEVTSTYGKEKAAFFLSLDWTRANCPTESKSIYFDNQSLLKTIQSDARDSQSIRHRLNNRRVQNIPTWTPEHKYIPDHEAAKEAATTADTPLPSSDAPLPIPGTLGPERPWNTIFAPGMQTA